MPAQAAEGNHQITLARIRSLLLSAPTAHLGVNHQHAGDALGFHQVGGFHRQGRFRNGDRRRVHHVASHVLAQIVALFHQAAQVAIGKDAYGAMVASTTAVAPQTLALISRITAENGVSASRAARRRPHA